MRKNYLRKKFNRKRKNTFKIFFLVIVGMTVGFAALNTTLQLIGTLNISRTTWNIHWTNPTKVGGVTATKDAALKTGDNTTVEYEVNLANQGDYYEFTVDAINEGTIDAMITGIDNKVYENSVEVQKPDYLDFTVTYADGTTIANNHLLKVGATETYKVKVQYKDNLTADQLPTSTRNLKFTFSVTYMQSDETTQIIRPINYTYKDSPYEFVVPKTGTYKIELWGAEGGTYENFQKSGSDVTTVYGGKGAYVKGNIVLEKGQRLYIYVGEIGTQLKSELGFNGGGSGGETIGHSGSGGGATDARLVSGSWDNFDSLKSRIIIAAGGGAPYGYGYGGTGGAAGGLTGYKGNVGTKTGDLDDPEGGTGATQTSGGSGGAGTDSSGHGPGNPGTFGIGGSNTFTFGSGGGGGYYGGGSGGANHQRGGAAGGGSSFISGYSGCDAIAESSTSDNIIHTGQPNHYDSTKVFTNSVMIDGNGCDWSTGVAANCGTNQPQPDGTMATGHSGNGYARITLIN